MRAHKSGLRFSRSRLLRGAIFFSIFLFGVEMCATMSRTGANGLLWIAAAVATLAGATGAGWLAVMPSDPAPDMLVVPAGNRDTSTGEAAFSGR
ncbi:MAG: hypothetical protein AB7Q42_04045 [Acidimicrobiia bacterium]